MTQKMIVFCSSKGILNYQVMSFGLKNVEVTYKGPW